ncbi:type IV pilus biogenesis protein PilM [Serratia symbiotica]|uniref:Conjugative transfer protein PilM n=1 Tax=Serratia symbiotica TaxID=138074 RepID=A0A455VNI3_9GAMM|nr:type IV pilus biogenesis protein PilM [Serratia symbiotica]BBI93080.1 conjugative transfer protein PilM [Serratia symbiotica]
MGYLILSFLLVTLSLAGFYQHQHADNLNSTEMTTSTTQQAIETVHYINAINDYLYRHPDVINNPNEVVLTAVQIGITPHSPIQHVIVGQRVFVWQPFSPGLMAALKAQTRDSALLGSVKNHRLFDNSGRDMQVIVPARIPDGAIVYLN